MRIRHTFILILFLLSYSMADNLKRDNILITDWKFEIGDNLEWAATNFDDHNWEVIKVPGSWESAGFPGYDGYAWYRVRFKIKNPDENASYYLRVGVIDDCDATFINGKLIGFQGSFPPNYFTAHQTQRHYAIPKQYLNLNGTNVVAIRVYDEGGPGGIKWGDVGLYKKNYSVSPIIEMTGLWKFHLNDDMDWKEPGFDDSNWKDIFVPGIWQFQGYQDHIGFAWYRREFELDEKWNDENLILLMGKIDDFDETYINGKLLGKTGNIPKNTENIQINNWAYNTMRAYYIPKNLLNYGGKNTIAVRVYDGKTYGGIYEGPIGIITRNQYLEYKNNQKYKHVDGFWEFLEEVFGN